MSAEVMRYICATRGAGPSRGIMIAVDDASIDGPGDGARYVLASDYDALLQRFEAVQAERDEYMVIASAVRAALAGEEKR